MALTDYTIDTSGSPQDVQRKQALADALMKQGQDSTPAAGGQNGGWITALNRGLAGALGGYQRGQAADEERQGRDSVKQLMANQLMGANGKVDPMASVALASNPWATPGQVSAVNHVGDVQHTAEREGIADKHWDVTNARAERAANESKFTIKEITNPDGTSGGYTRIRTDGPEGPIAGAAPQPQPQGAPAVTGPDYLKTIDPGRAAVVQGILDGRTAPPTGAALRSPQVMALMRDAAIADPGFDAGKWARRYGTAQDFSSKGKSGQSVTSLNTVYGHIADLAAKGQELNNVDGVPIINTYVNDAKNAYASGSGGDKANNFNLARNAVADEMSKVFKGAGISDHEIEQWKGTIHSSQSPTQLRGAIKTAFGLIESRMAALNNARDAGMDTNSDPRGLLSEESKAKYTKVQKWIDGANEKPTGATAPAAGVVQDGYRFKGGNPADQNSWEKVQ